jgi:hypothetical protein
VNSNCRAHDVQDSDRVCGRCDRRSVGNYTGGRVWLEPNERHFKLQYERHGHDERHCRTACYSLQYRLLQSTSLQWNMCERLWNGKRLWSCKRNMQMQFLLGGHVLYWRWVLTERFPVSTRLYIPCDSGIMTYSYFFLEFLCYNVCFMSLWFYTDCVGQFLLLCVFCALDTVHLPSL